MAEKEEEKADANNDDDELDALLDSKLRFILDNSYFDLDIHICVVRSTMSIPLRLSHFTMSINLGCSAAGCPDWMDFQKKFQCTEPFCRNTNVAENKWHPVPASSRDCVNFCRIDK